MKIPTSHKYQLNLTYTLDIKRKTLQLLEGSIDYI